MLQKLNQVTGAMMVTPSARVDSCFEKGVDFNTPCRLKSQEKAHLSPRDSLLPQRLPCSLMQRRKRAIAIPLLHEPAHASFSQYQHCPGAGLSRRLCQQRPGRDVWDFMLIFGAARQDSPDEVVLRNFQGIYLSPQQAKALWNLLGQNLAQYEQAFGAINLEPTQAFPAAGTGNGPIH